jgi:hypothetical protein
MTLKASTALRNKLLDTNPFKTIFNLGFLKLYDGPVPTTADAGLDAANHLLVTISNNSTGTGLTFEATAVAGAITKNTGETWSGTSITAGTASFYRLVTSSDTGATSTTEARLQGNIATSGADLNMTNTVLTSPTSYPIDAFSVSLPTL